jgi:sugar lactone lactonase YvrE
MRAMLIGNCCDIQAREPAMKIQVRVAFLIWLLAVIPLATILTAIPTAAAGPTPYCPGGLSYDSSTGDCQGPSTCPSGFNDTGESCEGVEVGSCPAGTYDYGEGVCAGIPSCPLGAILTGPSYVCAGPPPVGCSQGQIAGLVVMCTVIGQPTFANVTAGHSSSPFTIGNPAAVAFDSKGDLWVVDSYNSRVLEYKTPFTTGQAANLVIGQTSLTGTSYTSDAGGLFGPTGLAFDSKGNLWVVDSGDDRVLEFTQPFVNGENASLVLGQSSFEGYRGATTATGMESPSYLAFDQYGDLWVTDEGNNRVLEYTQPFSTGEAASLVLGQSNFTAASPTSGAKGLFEPNGIAFDGAGNLWVADSAHHRVLEYTAPFSTDEAASVAIGQSNLTNVGGTSTLPNAFAIAFDPSGNLWVSDGISGVLEFTYPLSTGEVGTEVIGPKAVLPNTLTANFKLDDPQGITFDTGNNLWVADYDHGRVIEYGTVAGNATASTSSVSTTTSTTKSSSGVPVFPYQFAVAAVFTVLLAASYLLIRRHALSEAGSGHRPPGSV